MQDNQLSNYEKHYSEKGLFRKILKYGKFLGKGFLSKVFVLYYVFKDRNTPDWVKTVIVGALGYFIFPLDLIPDLLPIAGFSDDIATIFAAVSIISSHITSEHKYLADVSVEGIFKKD